MAGEIRRGRGAIQEACGGGVQRLLERLEERGFDPQEDRKGWIALCPVHGDTNPSLAISEGDDGSALIYCRSHQCEYLEILKELDLEPRDVGSSDWKTKEETTVEYIYEDADGNPVRKVVRKPGKEFPQAYWDGKKWIWKDVAKHAPPLPYRLPEVLVAVEEGEIIYIAEGEKDVDRLVEVGVVATCNPGGAGKWTDELSVHLKGACVVVVQDHDDAGIKHAAEVNASLKRFDCDVLIVEAKVGKDAYDHLRMYGVEDFCGIEGQELIITGEVFGPGDFDKAWQAYEKKAALGPGPSLGFPDLDEYFFGQRGITIYAGPPKAGKSWVMVQTAWANIKEGKYPWLYPLEMPAEETYWRLACLAADMPWMKYVHNRLSDSDYKKLKGTIEQLDSEGAYKIVTPPQKERSIDHLVGKAQEAGAGAILVDQMQYVEVDGKSLGAHNQTGMYWDALNRARDLTDSICFAHQFNMRSGAGPLDAMPTIQQLKGSQAFEETATLVLGLWASKEMRQSGQMELGTLAARNHGLRSWHVAVDLYKRCNFEIMGVVEDDDD
jgi:hypothetical protein